MPKSTHRPGTFETGLPDWLRRRMAGRGWHQAELARELGIHSGMVSRWLSGATRPSPPHCGRIADLFGADISEVLHLAGWGSPAAEEPDDPQVAYQQQVLRQLRTVRLDGLRVAVLTGVLDWMRDEDQVRRRRGNPAGGGWGLDAAG